MKQTLLLIDSQQELMDGNEEHGPVYNKEQLIRTINNLIDQAQQLNIPVTIVRDLDVAGGTGDGFQVHREIKFPSEAKVFDKAATNAFHGTGLQAYLTAQHFTHLVIMGCETQNCIDTAVRTATVNGFDVTLVGDGHSTLGNDILTSEQIIHHHNSTLHGHYNVQHFSLVRNSGENVFEPTHDSYR